jgi:hypothetical protein
VLLTGVPVFAQDGSAKTLRSVSRSVRVMAEVQSIDLANRIVVLKREGVDPLTLRIDERARNLPQVRVGDQVKAHYLESLVLPLHKPGDSDPCASFGESTARMPDGERPRGGDARRVTIGAPERARIRSAQP